jgi:predicted MPP superfamily phosphohydrolase
MKKKISRRNFIRKILSFLGVIALGPFISFFGERNWLKIEEVDIHFNNLPIGFTDVRIVHFSDTHLGFYYDHHNLRTLVDRINSCKPDMICFTGDLVDGEYECSESAIPVLNELKAPLGKYAVLGNHDYRSDPSQVVSALTSSGFKVLINENMRITKDGSDIYIAGVDDILQGSPHIEKALEGIGENEFTILLAHEPDYADVTKDYLVGLQLSGHSHGGQIRLPIVGYLVTPPFGSKYVYGLYDLTNLKVYTNRGIGTTIYPFRLFCRPEITVINLKSKSLP